MTTLRQRPTAAHATWGPAEADSLHRGLARLGLDKSPEQFGQLQAYAGLLLKWNRTYNLLGATSPRSLIDDHLLDALATLPALRRWLPETAAAGRPVLLDIGAGAGLPGLALAIMQPNLAVVLVEPIGKKAAFMRQAIAHCQLTDAQVFEGRIEDLSLDTDLQSPLGTGLEQTERGGGQRPPGTPYFICRAFTSLARFAALCRPHTRQGSLLFAMKSSRVADEIAELVDAEVLAIEHLEVARGDVQRNLVVIRPDQARAP